MVENKFKSMPSSPLFPSADESEVADALLLLSEPKPSVWGSKKTRSVRFKPQSCSKITVKDESDNKIVPRELSPKSPICFHSTTDDTQPSSSDQPPSEKLPSEVPSRSNCAKEHGMMLKEQKERVTVLVRENLTLRKTLFEMKTRYLIAKEHNASLKRMKEGLILKRLSGSQFPMEGNAAVMEEMMRSMQFLTAAQTRRPSREECAAARKRRMELMRAKVGEKRRRLG